MSIREHIIGIQERFWIRRAAICRRKYMNHKHWAAVWGNAVSIGENRPESYGKNITLRYQIDSPFAGEAVKVTFDNYCGTEAITISKSSFWTGEAFVTLAYNGKESVMVLAGERVVSDAVLITRYM